MNCDEFRSRFPPLSLPIPGDFPSELTAARQHLEECDECRLAWESEVALDSKLARRMQSVLAPSNYAAELQRRFQTIRPATVTAHRVSFRRRWQFMVLALLLLIGIGGLLRIWSLAATTLELDELLFAIDHPSNSNRESWPAAVRTELPGGWDSISAIHATPPQRMPGISIPVQRISFQYGAPRSTAAPGTLWIVDAQRISDADSIFGFDAAAPTYGSRQSRLVWRENGMVYVLESETATLELLRTALLQSRSLA